MLVLDAGCWMLDAGAAARVVACAAASAAGLGFTTASEAAAGLEAAPATSPAAASSVSEQDVNFACI